MSAASKAALRARFVRSVILCQINHPEETFYLASGEIPITWNGNTFIPLGRLGSIEGVRSSNEPEVVETTFRLSGVDADLLAGLSSSVKNRSGLAWLAVLDERGRVVGEPDLIADTRLDTQRYQIGDDGRAQIEIVALGGMHHLTKRSAAKLGPEEQRAFLSAAGEDPDSDTGFDEMHLQRNTVLTWAP